MNTSLAMSGVYDEKPPPEVSADLSCSRNCSDQDDDWVIVKKQRVTILIPPSPDAANPQSHKPTINSKLSSITRSKRDWDAARKKHPDKVAVKKSQDSPLEHGTIVHGDVPMMTGDILSHSSASPVAKSESTKHVDRSIRESFHQETGKATSSFGSMDKLRRPVVSSPIANKIMRARLLERQVAGFGGLRNWLFDCGLGWFVDILDNKKLGMYQLVSLTMSQLKEMGLVAVGPRRKLIHAIDSLCGPHQVEMVS